MKVYQIFIMNEDDVLELASSRIFLLEKDAWEYIPVLIELISGHFLTFLVLPTYFKES